MLEPGDLIELGGTFLLYTEHRASPRRERDLTLAPSQLSAFSTLNPELEVQFQRAAAGRTAR